MRASMLVDVHCPHEHASIALNQLINLMRSVQVQFFLQSRKRHVATISVATLQKQLRELEVGTEVSNPCAYFISQLHCITDICGMQGRASVSRTTIRDIVTHFGRTELPELVAAQQEVIRQRSGTKIALDYTFKVASSLAGLLGKKMQQFTASVLTATVEAGYVVAAVLVPNDGQEWDCAVLRALYGADPRDSPYHAEVHARVSLGGRLAHFPMDICTDHVARNVNLWENVADDVVGACLSGGIAVKVPRGVRCESMPFMRSASLRCHVRATGKHACAPWACALSQSQYWMNALAITTQLGAELVPVLRPGDFRFPCVSQSITDTVELTAADLDDFDLGRIVINSQDHWHLLERIRKRLDKKHPDLLRFKARLSQIVARGSCQYNPPFAARTPKELQAEASKEAAIMQREMLGLIEEFRWTTSAASKEERLDAKLRSVGAALIQRHPDAMQPARQVQRGPATAPAAMRASGAPADSGSQGAGLEPPQSAMFQPRSLGSANRFETVSSQEVCRHAPMVHVPHCRYIRSVLLCQAGAPCRKRTGELECAHVCAGGAESGLRWQQS